MNALKRLGNGIGMGRVIAFALLVLLLIIRPSDPTFLQNLRNQSFDLYQRLKPREFKPMPVAIIDIDEASLRQYGQWPWPRTRMAELVRKLTQSGVIAIGFDIVFAEEDRLSPENIAKDNAFLSEEIQRNLRSLPSNDARFAAAIKRSRTVLGQTSLRNITDVDATNQAAIPDVPHAVIGDDPSRFLSAYPGLVQNRPELEANALGRGVFTVSPDPDGVFRHVPIVVRVEDKYRLSLSAELLRIATGGKAFAIKANKAGISSVKVGRGMAINTDRDGTVWPYFTETQPYRYVSVGDVLEGKAPPNRLKNHLVLVGTSAIGLEDFRPSPLGTLIPGVGIHAQVIENALSKQFLSRPNWALGAEIVAFAMAGLLAIIIVPFLGALWSAVAAGVLMATWVGGSWFAFDQYRFLVDPVFPSVGVALIFMMLATLNYLREEQQRKQIRGAFGQYVSPDLVNQLSDQPDSLTLGGETRELSVLFSDVRGFTAISESYKANPQGLTELMNLFLTTLSDAILRYRGTIDKFMGDAVMAFWNAPLENEKHAEMSCEAALDMIDDVDALNAKMLAEYEATPEEERGDYHAINVGIGINSGTCVVGNMGSRNRFDYTALGDTVNLASRLEGQSKPYGIKIVLGQNTAEMVEENFATLEVDMIRVKGKTEPERIYGLFGRKDMLETADFRELQSTNNSMLELYRKQDWESAAALIEILDEVSEKCGIDISEYLFIYKTRILEFETNPPGRNWDGVYNATSK